MAAVVRTLLTPSEYLVAERSSEIKHEYVAGELLAMSGASRKHNLIQNNLGTILNGQFRDRPCEVYGSDMRVKIEALGIYTYPDLSAVCGVPHFEDGREDSLLNPAVVIEIASPSTRANDRGLKFQRYQLITALEEYLLIAQDIPFVERFVRQEDGIWLPSEIRGITAVATIDAIGCVLSLAEVYRKVSLRA